MTAEEEAQLDLAGRMAFAERVDENLRPFLLSLDSFAGIYYEPETGDLVIRMRNRGQQVEAQIAARVPEGGRWRIQVADVSEAELVDGSSVALAAVKASRTRLDMPSVGVDTAAGSLYLPVRPDQLAAGRQVASQVADATGLAVDLRAAEPDAPAHCTLRTHCHGPTAAGIVVTNGRTCTMGFHIVAGGDREFVTSGHCSYGMFGNAYRHAALANALGAPAQWLYFQGGQDIVRVNLTAGEESDNVFNEGTDIIGMGTPAQGETLCASLGAGSNIIKCGTVTTTWVSNNFGAAWGSFDLWGGDMSYTTIGGDSGSPVYRRIPGGTGDRLRAVGVNSSVGGHFARLDQSLDNFGAVVFQ